MTGHPDRGKRVKFRFTRLCCGEDHEPEGIQSATPGLIVYKDGPPNFSEDCWGSAGGEDWSIWATGDERDAANYLGDRFTAMRLAEELSPYRDWESRWDRATEPTVEDIGRDLQNRGVWPP